MLQNAHNIYSIYVTGELSVVVSAEFEKMKERSDETLEYLRGRVRFDIGKHRKTKLKCLDDLKDKTLLSRSVAEKHAEKLEKQFLGRWEEFTKEQMIERLRFWTVLYEVVPLNVDHAVEKTEEMFQRLKSVCDSIRGIEVIGVAEIEVVSVEKMKAMASEDDEARKLNVIVDMLAAKGQSTDSSVAKSYALVHFHGIVDVGAGGEVRAQKIRDECERYWKESYQVEVKRLYSNKTLKKNLKDIAAYLTKGGNEILIYKIGFGYDEEEKINRQLVKSGRATMEKDYAGFENELSLSVAEIKFLGATIHRLMMRTGSKSLQNGYLFKGGKQLR